MRSGFLEVPAAVDVVIETVDRTELISEAVRDHESRREVRVRVGHRDGRLAGVARLGVG